MGMSHLLASPVSLLNSSGSAALISISLSSSSLVRGSIWIGEWEESGGEESGELGGDGIAGGAGRSKCCIWVRSPNGIMDHKQEPLEEVGGGWKREWDGGDVRLYNDPVLITLHGGGAGSTVGGGADEDPIASSSSWASWAVRSVVRFISFMVMTGYYHLIVLWEFRHSSTRQIKPWSFVMSIMMLTTVTFMPIYPQEFLWSGMETQHI